MNSMSPPILNEITTINEPLNHDIISPVNESTINEPLTHVVISPSHELTNIATSTSETTQAFKPVQYINYTGPPKIPYKDMKFNRSRGKYNCGWPGCHKSYTRKHDLRVKHYVWHLHGEKPFKCDLCHKQFKAEGMVYDHLYAVHQLNRQGQRIEYPKCSVCNKLWKRRHDKGRCAKKHKKKRQ